MSKAPYSVITIIYNPNSTGQSERRAKEAVAALRDELKGAKVRLRASKHRGHMEQIAYRTALLSRHALIVAVSGDGGYNEVVNGVLRAQKRGRKVTAGLIPAGNANDHYASVHRGGFAARVAAGDEDRIDVLRVTGRHERRALTRYGHSYAGVGISPQAGEKLNQTSLNPIRELKIVANVLIHLKAVKLIVDNRVVRYDSLVFSNTGRMSKVIKLSRTASLHDGLFEVSHVYRRNKFKLIGVLMRAGTTGLKADERTGHYEFETVRQTAVQIDGEIVRFDAGSRVSVTSCHDCLHCIV